MCKQSPKLNLNNLNITTDCKNMFLLLLPHQFLYNRRSSKTNTSVTNTITGASTTPTILPLLLARAAHIQLQRCHMLTPVSTTPCKVLSHGLNHNLIIIRNLNLNLKRGSTTNTITSNNLSHNLNNDDNNSKSSITMCSLEPFLSHHRMNRVQNPPPHSSAECLKKCLPM